VSGRWKGGQWKCGERGGGKGEWMEKEKEYNREINTRKDRGIGRR
jgi:hypothetical protein